MIKLLICFLSVVLAGGLFAEEKEVKTDTGSDNTATVALSGTISDFSSGELLTGVEVAIEGSKMKTYTDFDGKFTFENIKPGEYKLVTNYISYKKGTEILKVNNKENEINIKLKNSN